MFHISFEVLDMALAYINQISRISFLNKEIPLFNAPAVQNWSLQKKSMKRKKQMKYT